MDAGSGAPWRTTAEGVELTVRVTPRASRTTQAGITADAQGRAIVQIRLAAPPVDGAANEALVAYLASAIGVRKQDVTVRVGHASRVKQVAIRGDGTLLADRLARWIAAG